jgi:hypothetical protein
MPQSPATASGSCWQTETIRKGFVDKAAGVPRTKVQRFSPQHLTLSRV